MSERRLFISFSGGETSALMSKLIMENMAEEYDEIITGFANTGEEREETLVFADRCDKTFGLNLVWIEGVVSERGTGSSARVVSFESAARRGQPFEAMIKKYGIPNPSWPHCTRELKTRPITAYLRGIGWGPGTYDTAIGIRRDEIDRMSSTARENRLLYPLVGRFPRTKPMVNEYWARQPFRLGIKGYQGNCKHCWKKSLRKHLTIMSETPEVYEFTSRMEREYGMAGTNPNGEPRVFFRQNRSTEDLRKMAREIKFTPASDDAREYQIDLLDWLDADIDACGSETCEIDFEGIAA